MTVLPTQRTAEPQPVVPTNRIVAVRKILVDQLVGLGHSVEFIRAIPALLNALAPHLDPTPIADPSRVLINSRLPEVRRVNHPLSDREVQVLQLVAGGHPNREIGVRLGITEDTVKSHLRRMMRRLGVRDRAEAVAVGLRQGILR